MSSAAEWILYLLDNVLMCLCAHINIVYRYTVFCAQTDT